MIKKLDELIDAVKLKGKKRLVAAFANDSHTIGAASMAMDLGVVDATLVGDIDTIKSVCEKEGIDVKPWVMIPLIGHVNELKVAKEILEKVFGKDYKNHNHSYKNQA